MLWMIITILRVLLIEIVYIYKTLNIRPYVFTSLMVSKLYIFMHLVHNIFSFISILVYLSSYNGFKYSLTTFVLLFNNRRR